MMDSLIKQILVVDDYEEYGKMVRHFLQQKGYACDIVLDAFSALDKLQQTPFDLVITDIKMPGMDGLEFTRKVKAAYPHLEVIIMTAHAEEYSYSDIIGAGAADFIPKPFEMEKLLAKIQRLNREKTTLNQLLHSEVTYRKLLDDVVKAISITMEIRDPYTAGHQQRVTELAAAVASEMELSDELIKGLYLSGLLHDIGKISVPSDILNKPGKLKFHEMELIKDHSVDGYEILKGIKFPWPVAQIVYQHHERMDGSGYPQGLKGESILLEAKILGVADVIEAMTSHRPYRPALGLDIALSEITQKKGVLYDPGVVDACLRLFHTKKYQIG